MKNFIETYGFERADAGLHNWRETPYSAWSFQNVNEIVPSVTIPASKSDAASRAVEAPDFETGNESIGEFLARSQTDSFLVSKAGQLKLEWHAPHVLPGQPHILFSISKSLTGLLAGILQDQGLLDPHKPVAHYLPETAQSGYGDCPLQYVLDMRVSLDFVEDYLDTQGDYARYRRATGWNPVEAGQTAEGLATFLFSLAKGDEPHVGPFRYLSPNSDLLGLVLERITGTRFADLMSQLLWKPLGAGTDASITLDAHGAPRTAGGISATPHDLLMLGEMILHGGSAVGGAQIISEHWLDDMCSNGDADAWAYGDFAASMGPGRYRNKWYQLGPNCREIAGVGIHGQWLYIDPDTEVVIARTASQAVPLDEQLDLQSLTLFRQVSKML